MIIEGIVILLVSAVLGVLSFLPNIPNFPNEVEQSVETYMDLIFENLDFLSFFIRPETAKFIIVSAIGIYTFKIAYDIVMWVLRKIPIFGID